jgi:hypothetical protein
MYTRKDRDQKRRAHPILPKAEATPRPPPNYLPLLILCAQRLLSGTSLAEFKMNVSSHQPAMSSRRLARVSPPRYRVEKPNYVHGYIAAASSP